MTLRALGPDLEAATRQINEDPVRREEDLAHILEWLKKQPHLNVRKDPQWLIAFLRGCKFSLERTKNKLDTFYTLKTALPELFTNRDPMRPEIQEILKLGVLLPLPEPDSEGRRVILMRNGIYDPDKIKIADLIKTNLMFMDTLMKDDDYTVINGTVSILDHSGNTLAHMVHFTPSLIKKMMTTFQDGYPMRPKAMHHVNLPNGFMTIFNLFLSFMKDKLKRRVFLHADNMDKLFEEVPKRIMPKEYGGEAGTLEKITEEWKRRIEQNRQWFIEDDQYKTDEKKRPGGKPKTAEDLFGLDGSFRQLAVD